MLGWLNLTPGGHANFCLATKIWTPIKNRKFYVTDTKESGKTPNDYTFLFAKLNFSSIKYGFNKVVSKFKISSFLCYKLMEYRKKGMTTMIFRKIFY